MRGYFSNTNAAVSADDGARGVKQRQCAWEMFKPVSGWITHGRSLNSAVEFPSCQPESAASFHSVVPRSAMEGGRQLSPEFSMSWSLARTRGARSSRSPSSVMQQHLFRNTIRRPHFSTSCGDGSVDIMEKRDRGKRLAPLPRFDPYRRMRAVSTSSVVENEKDMGCEWTSALGPMKRRRHNSECARRGSFPVLQCNGVGV
ncbi:hypothetical protein C8Q74DRAFT_468280 [Fomes fomentarius]|nr:hypothetical protein C8Q74DRAFT_468280 [Fomes fomentarius]